MNSMFLLILAGLICIASADEKTCVMGDVCGYTTTIAGNISIACARDQAPQPLRDASFIRDLKAVCPELDLYADNRACCDDEQGRDMLNQLNQAKQILVRCPSCYVNFAKTFCHMTCSPNQRRFLTVTKTIPTKDKKLMVDEVQFRISDNFVHRVFNSCVNVRMPDMGTKAIMLLCAKYGTSCTARLLFDYIGTKDPSPYTIHFNFITKDDPTALNPNTVSCGKAPVGYSNKSCSCFDCNDACPIKQNTYQLNLTD